MHRLVILLILAAAMPNAACTEPFVDKTGHFVFHNTSPNPVTFHVNNGQGYVVPGNDNKSYDIEVPIPKTPRPPGYFGTPTGPSNNDKTVMVAISVKNPSRPSQSPYRDCGAGAKVITKINYKVDANGDHIECGWTSPYSY